MSRQKAGTVMLKTAFFAKNLPYWERALRSLGALSVVVGAWSLGSPYRELGVGAAAVLLLTGLVGFCPMCALVGRKLPTAQGQR
jgi:hypothetical protein